VYVLISNPMGEEAWPLKAMLLLLKLKMCIFERVSN
jgi:hypothetical protein